MLCGACFQSAGSHVGARGGGGVDAPALGESLRVGSGSYTRLVAHYPSPGEERSEERGPADWGVPLRGGGGTEGRLPRPAFRESARPPGATAQRPELEALRALEGSPAEQVLARFLELFAGGGGGRAGGRAAKARLVRGLGAVLEAADCRWLLRGFPWPARPGLLRDVGAALGRYAAPLQEEAEGPGGEDPSALEAARRGADAGLVLCSVVAKLAQAGGAEGPGPAAAGAALRQVAGPAFVLAVTHVAERPWSSAGSRRRAQGLLEGLLRAAGCQSVPEFLRGVREGEDGWLAVVMQCLEPELTRETWQRNPATKYVFSSVLQQVTRPWLSQHLEKVLPPSLLLSDDYRVENKILGVQCLHHIIRNVPAADLCQFNRAQVVNHALSIHLYSKEAQLMEIVLRCVFDLLPVLEKALLQQSHNPPLVAPTDEVLQLVLMHMEAENQLSLRRVYARNLPVFVEKLGIQITRHLKRLQRVIVGYLEISDGPEETARLAMLDTLKCTIQHAWPRMTCHLRVLLKALLRLMWDVATDRSSTPETVKAELLQRTTECLLLLDHSVHGQVKVLLQGIYQQCQNDHLKEYLKKIQVEPVELNKDV